MEAAGETKSDFRFRTSGFGYLSLHGGLDGRACEKAPEA
jgi:hypothetical protein